MLSLAQVVFEPTEEVKIPTTGPSFPAVPSAKYYRLSGHGYRIPVINTVGTRQEQEESLKIWYSLKSDLIFPLETAYATARKDQIGLNSVECPASKISLSLKNYLRQRPDSSDWFFDDFFQFILGQTKRGSLSKLINDFYRFPTNPEANIFKAARLIEQYTYTGDETPLRKYLKDAYAFHLSEHSFGYYPTYELFFLLTRFASPPMSEEQLHLAERRNRTEFNSPERVFIDAVFEYEVYNLSELLKIIDQISTEGPEEVGKRFGTRHADWVRWADEYLRNKGKEAEKIEHLGDQLHILTDKFYTWTDYQIEELAQELELELPLRYDYPTRYSWVERIAITIRRFRV